MFCCDVINFQLGIPRQSGQIKLAVFDAIDAISFAQQQKI
jgi:hypothetical protein